VSELTTSQKDTLTRFTAGAERLEALVQGLPEEALDSACAPGEWTIRQVVHHLADDCDVWSMCIKKAIATPDVLVRFEGFPGNECWADGLAFECRGVEPALTLIKAHRRYIAHLATHLFDAWDRSFKLGNAQGEVLREFSVREIIEMLTDHMSEHIAVIETIAGQVGEPAQE
jgi:hypothetical protein